MIFDGQEFYDQASQRQMMIKLQEGKAWLFYKHADGGWVSLRLATQADIDAIEKTRETKFTATILQSSPRYAQWLEVFGVDQVPVLAPLPHRAKGPDGEVHEFYKMDISSLTEEQRERLVNHLSRKFQMTLAEVNQQLDQIGLPILADDVSVPIDMRFII